MNTRIRTLALLPLAALPSAAFAAPAGTPYQALHLSAIGVCLFASVVIAMMAFGEYRRPRRSLITDAATVPGTVGRKRNVGAGAACCAPLAC